MAQVAPEGGARREGELDEVLEGELPEAEASAPEATNGEVAAWYWYDVASSSYSAVAISAFLPLLLQQSALEAAGFPDVCPNIVRNETQINEVFGNSSGLTAMFRTNIPTTEAPCPDADTTVPCIGEFCRGVPSVVYECRTADGSDRYMLEVVPHLEPTMYATMSIALSVVLQIILFLSCGSVGDYGMNRRTYLVVATVLGSLITAVGFFVTPATWELGAPILIFSNSLFGLTQLLYNSYLPLLVRARPDYRQALADREPAAQLFDREQKMSALLSSHGLSWGFLGSVLATFVCTAIAAILRGTSTTLAYRLSMVVTAVWWTGIGLPALFQMQRRPGPPLPPGQSLLSASAAASWHNLRSTWADLRGRLHTAFYFLLIWFFSSDGAFIIGTVGLLYANTEVEWGCIGKVLGLAFIFNLSPLSAGVGGFLLVHVSRALALSPKVMLIISFVFLLVAPVWGMLGYLGPGYGLRTGGDMLVVSAIWGVGIGSFQAFARSIFGTLIPRGRESAFWSVYELTNKGSAVIGPLVLTGILGSTGDIRHIFPYIIAVLVLPLIGLFFIDVEKGHKESLAAALIPDAEGPGGELLHDQQAADGDRRLAAADDAA